MYGLTLRTHKKNGVTEPLGGAITQQNMKFPLTSIQFCEIKCYTKQMHWFNITKLRMCHEHHPLKVPKIFRDSAT
jgi:hypothetical protein